ncbi:MAG: leucyl/phenylalanyl-tRNA--protein transferase [Rhodospirillaceae bacterium]|nr:leucyl/phenylalanyl-tRNA--protein transferase [Rhodospirillaceae bacterium]
MSRPVEITPVLLLKAYAHGYFPMAETGDSEELFWLDPPMRGILPLEDFHIPKRLRREIRRRRFDVRCDTDFAAVLRGCAETTPWRPQTWINADIYRLYSGLFAMGHAHSVECWEGAELVGGLYGVALGAAFFGESMFSRVRDASKVALVHLVALLRQGGFTLLDTQFTTDHLARFGGHEIPQALYKAHLHEAMSRTARWQPDRMDVAVAALLASDAGRPPIAP